MRVTEIMATDLVVCTREDSLETVGRKMIRESVGSAIVEHEGVPDGILTKTDCVEMAIEADKPLSALTAKQAMSDSLATIDSKRSIREAVEHMIETGFRKLPVVEDMKLVGMVTLTDVVYHYSDLREEIRQIERTNLRGSSRYGGDADW